MHSSKNYSLREKAVIEFVEEQQIILINELRFLCIICQTFGLAPIDTFPNAGDGLETWPRIDDSTGQVYDEDLVYIEYAVL